MLFNNLTFLPGLAFLDMFWLFSQNGSGNPICNLPLQLQGSSGHEWTARSSLHDSRTAKLARVGK